MPVCKVCNSPKSSYVMNNKLVCFHCDELLFDIEIECEEIETPLKKAEKQSQEKQESFGAKKATKSE